MEGATVNDAGFQQSLMKAANIHLKIAPIVSQYADLIANRIKASMAEPKHGKAYKYKGGIHIASAPGEAPAIKTTKLVNSIQIKITGMGMSAEIGSFGVGYAADLEKGITLAARPYMQPAFDRYNDAFVTAIRKAVRT